MSNVKGTEDFKFSQKNLRLTSKKTDKNNSLKVKENGKAPKISASMVYNMNRKAKEVFGSSAFDSSGNPEDSDGDAVVISNGYKVVGSVGRISGTVAKGSLSNVYKGGKKLYKHVKAIEKYKVVRKDSGNKNKIVPRPSDQYEKLGIVSKNNLIEKSTIHKTATNEKKSVYKTTGNEKSGIVDKKEKDKGKKERKDRKQKEGKYNRTSRANQDMLREHVIKELMAGGESKQENNMSTGFMSMVSRVTKSYVRDISQRAILALLKKIIAITGSIISTVIGFFGPILISILTPIIIIMLVVSIVFGTVFAIFFGDMTDYRENEKYMARVLNGYYDEVDQEIYDWLMKNGSLTDAELNEDAEYNVTYVNGCDAIDNFSDCILLYLTFVADMDSVDIENTEDISDLPFVYIDTTNEITQMQTLFSQMNYCEEDPDNPYNLFVYHLTADEWIAKYGLTDEQLSVFNDLKDSLDSATAEGMYIDSRSSAICLDIDIDALKPSKSGKKVVDCAMKYLGCPYEWGATGPNSFDCSGFVYYVFKETGVYTGGRASAAGYKSIATPISEEEAQPGDLVFFTNATDGTHHIGIYIGEGKMIHAPQTGDVVKISSIWRDSDTVSFGRLSNKK